MRDQMITAREAAERLRCSVRSIDRWVESGVLPVVRLQRRGRRLFRTSDIDRLLGLGDAADDPQPRRRSAVGGRR